MSGKRSTPKSTGLSGVLGGTPSAPKSRKGALGTSPLGGGSLGGKGLGALIPGGSKVGRLLEVSVEQIQPDPKQPRKRFQVDALEELATSIKAQGVLQPLIVTPLGGGRYQIIAGERRWRASKIAGLRAVPVVSRETSEQEAFELALLENIQRVDLSPLEEALSYHRLSEEFNLSHEQIATRTGKRRSTISNALRLLKLPAQVITMLDEGQLSAGHGRALLGLSDEQTMIELGHRAAEGGWSVRELERRVREASESGSEQTDQSGDPVESSWVSELSGEMMTAFEAKGISVKVSADPNGGAQLKLKIEDEAAARDLLGRLSRSTD